MAESADEVMAQDRVMGLVRRNPSLGRVLFGLTTHLAQMCDERALAPEGLRFETPHLDQTGLMAVRFSGTRHGRARHRESFELGGVEWLHASNRALARFLRSCRSWRRAIDDVYDRAARYGAEVQVPFEELVFGTGRINDQGRVAWLTVYRDQNRKVEATRAGR